MRFNQEDIKRGFKVCECGYKHVLESGTDFPDECWILCNDCKCYVVDEKRVKSEAV